MKILCIDTSSDICGVSILENSNLLIKLDNNTGKTHSEKLMPMIKTAFDKTNLSLKNIDLIACNIGPGSFTGIRIGVASSKAFQDSLNIPCIGISSLESLAYNILLKNKSQNNCYFDANKSNLICSILDCKNNNCYFALYKTKGDYLESLITPECSSIDTCISILQSYLGDNFEKYNITFVGNGSKTFKNQIKEFFEFSKISDEYLDFLNSYNLGICAFDKYTNGLFLDKEILPIYLKKPQAQMQLENGNIK